MKSKKYLLYGILVILFIALLVWGLAVYTGKHTVNPNPDVNKTQPEVITNQDKASPVEFSNIVFSYANGQTKIEGKATNKGDKELTFTIKISFRDKDNNVLVVSSGIQAVAKGFIENLKPGAAKSFTSSITGDYTQADNYLVEVENILE